MCGRFILVDVTELGLRFRVQVTGETAPVPRFNIAPTQSIWTITNEDGTRRAEEMRWGLIPAWAKSANQIRSYFNARDDKDVRWTAELAIPWAELPEPGDLPPKPGAAIHLNLFRLDRAKDGKQDAGAWSAPIRPDFHALDRFARITLQGPEPTSPAP